MYQKLCFNEEGSLFINHLSRNLETNKCTHSRELTHFFPSPLHVAAPLLRFTPVPLMTPCQYIEGRWTSSTDILANLVLN